MKALKALNKSGSENPACKKEIFNSLNYDLKKKYPKWSRTSVVDDLTARTLFTEKTRIVILTTNNAKYDRISYYIIVLSSYIMILTTNNAMM